jgi:hypothetical protein
MTRPLTRTQVEAAQLVIDAARHRAWVDTLAGRAENLYRSAISTARAAGVPGQLVADLTGISSGRVSQLTTPIEPDLTELTERVQTASAQLAIDDTSLLTLHQHLNGTRWDDRQATLDTHPRMTP